MTQQDQRWLLNCFKVLADATRLNLIAWLSRDEYKIHELAALVGVGEPTVSHHVSKLRAAGLVHLREDGPQRFYRLNAEALAQFKAAVAQLEQYAPEEVARDDKWIDALSLSDDDKKVLREATFNGRLRRIPSKEKKLQSVLRWLATRFEPGKLYTEQQVNTIIRQVHDDYATLRRDMVDFGYLRRERGGSTYWLTPDDEQSTTEATDENET